MTQNTTTSQLKSLIGCLGRRVLSISFLLLVIPLMIHTIMIYREARHHMVIDNLNNLSQLSRSESLYVQQLIRQNLADIKTISKLGNFADINFSQEDKNIFSDIALTESLTSFFLAEKNNQGAWEILAAARPERMMQKDIDNDEYNKILNVGSSVYLYQDPIVQKKELRIGYAISPNRILISGTPLETVSSALIRAPTLKQTPIAAFATSDTDLYYSSFNGFDLNQTKLFSPEQLIDVPSQPLDSFTLSQNDLFIGIKTPVANNAFYLVIALSKSQFQDITEALNFNHLIQLSLLFVVIGGGGVFFLTSRIVRPLKQLFSCLEKVGEGDLKVRYQIDSIGFELNVLGQKFNEMLTNLEINIQEAKKQKLAKELLKQEFGIGQDIQKSILRTALTEAGNFVFAQAFTPAMEVSGDFYDVFKIDDKKILICCADTAGKGISACLYSLGARSMLRALAKTGLDLEKVCKEMNDLFLEDAENQGAFITAFIGILDLQTSKLSYVSCGHPPAFLLTDKQVTPLETAGMALGADSNFAVHLHEITLGQNDKVLIYTDGVIEAQNIEGEMFTMNRLKTFLDGQKVHTASVVVHDLQKDVETFTGKAELHDDVTILCIERKK